MDVEEEREVRIEDGCRKEGREAVSRSNVLDTEALMLLAEASMLLATSLGDAGKAGIRDLIRAGVVARALERSVSEL